MKFRAKRLTDEYHLECGTPFAISCDDTDWDSEGPHVEHTHDEDGHTFPCTLETLRAFARDLLVLLAEEDLLPEEDERR